MRSTKNVSAALTVALLAGSAAAQPLILNSQLQPNGIPDLNVFTSVGSQDRGPSGTSPTVTQVPVDLFIVDDPEASGPNDGVQNLTALFRQDDEADYTTQELDAINAPDSGMRVGDSITLEGDTAIANGPFPSDRIALWANAQRFLVGLGFDQRLPEVVYAFRTAEAGQITITQNTVGGADFGHVLNSFDDRSGITDFDVLGDSSFFSFVSLSAIEAFDEDGSFGFFAPNSWLLGIDGEDFSTPGTFNLTLSLEPAPPANRTINETVTLIPGDGSDGSASSARITNTTAGQDAAIRTYRNAFFQTQDNIIGAEYAVRVELTGSGTLRHVQREPFTTNDVNNHDYIYLDDPDEGTPGVLELTPTQAQDPFQTGALINTADTFFYDSDTQDVLGNIGDPENPDPALQSVVVLVIDTEETNGDFDVEIEFLDFAGAPTIDDSSTLTGEGSRIVNVSGTTTNQDARVFSHVNGKGGTVLGPPDPEFIYELDLDNSSNPNFGAVVTYEQLDQQNTTTSPQVNPGFHRFVIGNLLPGGVLPTDFRTEDIRGGGITTIVPIITSGLDFEEIDGLGNFDELAQNPGQPEARIFEPFAAHEIPGPETLGDSYATPVIPAGDYYISVEEITKQELIAPYNFNLRVTEVEDFVDLGVDGDPNGLVEITTGSAASNPPGALSDPALAVFDGSTGELLLNKDNNQFNPFIPGAPGTDLQASIVTGIDSFASPFDSGRVQLGSEETFVFVYPGSPNNIPRDDNVNGFILGDPRFSVGDFGVLLDGATVDPGESFVQLTVNQVTLNGAGDAVATRTPLFGGPVQVGVDDNQMGVVRFRLGTRAGTGPVVPPATVGDAGVIGNSSERLSISTLSSPANSGGETDFDTGLAVFREDGRLYDVSSDGGVSFPAFDDNFGSSLATLLDSLHFGPGNYFLAVYSDRPNAGVDLDGSIDANFFVGSGDGFGTYNLNFGTSDMIAAAPGNDATTNASAVSFGVANGDIAVQDLSSGEIDFWEFEVADGFDQDPGMTAGEEFEALLAQRVADNGMAGTASEDFPAVPLVDLTSAGSGAAIPFGTRLRIESFDLSLPIIDPVTGELQNNAVATHMAIWDEDGNLIRWQEAGGDVGFTSQMEGIVLTPGTYYGAVSGDIAAYDDSFTMYDIAINFGNAIAGAIPGGEVPLDFLDADGTPLFPRVILDVPSPNPGTDRNPLVVEPDSTNYNNAAAYFKFEIAAPTTSVTLEEDLGVVDETGLVTIRTENSATNDPAIPFDPELALYDSTGELLAINDDVTNFTQPGGLESVLDGLDLDPGDYVVAVATNPTGFADEFLAVRNFGALENGGGFRTSASVNPFNVGEGTGLYGGGGFVRFGLTDSPGGSTTLVVESSVDDNIDDTTVTLDPIVSDEPSESDPLSDAKFFGFTVGQVPSANPLDFNGDGSVDIADLVGFLNEFFTGTGNPALDFNSDGSTDIADVVEFLNSFFASP